MPLRTLPAAPVSQFSSNRGESIDMVTTQGNPASGNSLPRLWSCVLIHSTGCPLGSVSAAGGPKLRWRRCDLLVYRSWMRGGPVRPLHRIPYFSGSAERNRRDPFLDVPAIREEIFPRIAVRAGPPTRKDADSRGASRRIAIAVGADARLCSPMRLVNWQNSQ